MSLIFILMFMLVLDETRGSCSEHPEGVFTFGHDCNLMCHCRNNEQCDDTTGECKSGCASMWYGPGCQYRDIAEGEFSRHSSNVNKPQYSYLANDGDLSTCSKTGRKEENPFWRVWFPTSETIREVTLVTQADKLDSFKRFVVYVEDVPEFQKAYNNFIPTNRSECYRHGDNAPNNQSITIVCTKAIIGNQVKIQLNVKKKLILCDVRINGGRNIAFRGKTKVKVQPLIRECTTGDNCASSLAVDGSESIRSWTRCSYSNDPEWRLDLENTMHIWYTRIFSYNKDYKLLQIELLNTTSDDSKSTIKSIQTEGQANNSFNAMAKEVIISKEWGNLVLCEVQVFGDCPDGLCGYHCTSPCHCKDTTVWEKISGVCTSDCKNGWTGERCDKCVDNCKERCSANCKDGTNSCNHVTGECSNGCKTGWKGLQCDVKCDRGTYGDTCKERCSANCKDGTNSCDHVTGECSNGCKTGLKGLLCDVKCDRGTYGDNCKEQCSTNCKEGTNLCDHVTGECYNGCKTGWKGPQCNVKCNWGTYGDNCIKQCSTNCNDGTNLCDDVTGECSNGCKKGWKGATCEKICEKGTYGDNCKEQCSINCKNGTNVCDHVTGVCSNGCKKGWKEPTCEKICERGTYGDNCKELCSANCKDGTNLCGHVNGECFNGCKKGWKGPMCDVKCNRGTYGDNCREHCSINCKDGRYYCNHVNGECSNGCKSGWKGPMCEKICERGTYGVNCKERCGANCNDGTNFCHHVDGNCSNGCKKGWIGPTCEKICEKGTYGDNCKERCSTNCKDGTNFCDHVTGQCSNGCKKGWKGLLCDVKCDGGTYGDNCKERCSTNCKNGTNLCDHVTGECSNGCKTGWKGPLCDVKCDGGTYGDNCKERCSTNCKNGTNSCDHVTGECSNGCKTGWKGPICDVKCARGTYGDNCKERCSTNCKNGTNSCDHVTGECSNGCKTGWKGLLCDVKCDEGTYGDNCTEQCSTKCKDETEPCNHIDGLCVGGCKEGWIGQLCLEELKPPADTMDSSVSSGVASAVAAVVVVIGIVLIVIVVYRRRKRKDRDSSSTADNSRQHYFNVNDKALARDSDMESSFIDARRSEEPNMYSYARCVDVRRSASTSAIMLQNLLAFIRDNPGRIVEQYQSLPAGMIHPHTVAKQPCNKGKNKYRDMYAYDHSRVVLQTLQEKEGSDYINACYIKGYFKKDAYIAAQGPIPTSINSFWRMIWEKDIFTVAMLTNPVEENKTKCLEYWPLNGSSAKYGDICVSMVSETVFSEFTIRALRISTQDENQPSKHIRQFHYTAWPDKDVPKSASSMLQFWRKVRKNDASKAHTWLVHCSAGVGRTGTFIATDILFDEAMETNSVDVFQCVSGLREQRVNMVQTMNQYRFLHELMVENFILPAEPVPLENCHQVANFLNSVDQATLKTRLLLQYETLNGDITSLKPTQFSEDTYSAAMLQANHDKNRYSDIIPANEFRPFLITNMPNCTNYINAVYIPGYCDPHGYILTQAPLKNTAIDCCRLIYEQETKLVVTFEDKKGKNVGVYLPESGSVSLGPFTMVKNSEEERKMCSKATFTLSYGSEDRSITQLIFKGWPQGSVIPYDVQGMIDFIQEVEYNRRLANNNPVIVQCLNGSDKSGLLVVLMNILERARLENEVSIPQVIRQIRTRREQIIPNFEQYKFCYDVLLCHVENNLVYANL